MLSNKEIGERIHARRIHLELPLYEVAAKVGVASSTILRYEKGEFAKIKVPIIDAIGHALNVNPSWLIGLTDDPAPINKSAPRSIDLSALDAEKADLLYMIIERLRQLSPEQLRKAEDYLDLLLLQKERDSQDNA